MGRPVDKQFFGPDAIQCIANVGNGEAAGYIVKQTASSEFLVNAGGTEKKCHLVNKAPADLLVGEMVITVQLADDTVATVTTLKGHKLTTSQGNQVVWNTGVPSNPAPVAVSTNDDVVPFPDATPVAPTVTENGSISTKFTADNRMLVGTGNPINNMMIATDGVIEVAIGAHLYNDSNVPASVDSKYTMQLATGIQDSLGNPKDNKWVYAYSIGLKQNPNLKAITDLYDVTASLKKDDAEVATLTLEKADDSLQFVFGIADNDPITDSYVGTHLEVIQNTERFDFIDSSYTDGSYSVSFTATPKGVGDPVTAAFTVEVAAPVAP